MTELYAAQRRFPRMTSENAVLVKTRGSDPAEGFAKTRVVGLGGCMFVLDESIGAGVQLDLLMSVRGRVVKTLGRVVYEISKTDDEIEIGVEFVGLAGHDRAVIESLFNPRWRDH